MCSTGESFDPPEVEPNDCPGNYGLIPKYNGDCYMYLADSLRTWDQGEGHCQQDGIGEHKGRATSVLSPYEQGFMFATLHTDHDNVDSGIWIGLTDREVRLVWFAMAWS